MLEDVAEVLACPYCGAELSIACRGLRCPAGHSFDLARHGYVSLLSGRSRTGTADTAAMVGAREGFLAAGHFAPIAEQVAARVRRAQHPGPVLDIGAGTGYYLARVLERLDEAAGVALDVSKYACRRSAKAHPRIGAVVSDAWQRLPVRDGSVSTVLNVFAPRNPAETHRVLRKDGLLVVVTPNAGHLGALVARLGLLSVDERKPQRLSDQLGSRFEPLDQHVCEFELSLGRDEVDALVAMGPSAWHSTDAVHERIAALPDRVEVTASVTVSAHRPRRTD
ncbi:putative RNA methyltransferase [Parasphingorhabdus pacifica]